MKCLHPITEVSLSNDCIWMWVIYPQYVRETTLGKLRCVSIFHRGFGIRNGHTTVENPQHSLSWRKVLLFQLGFLLIPELILGRILGVSWPA